MLSKFHTKSYAINLINILLQFLSVIILYRKFNLDILGNYYLIFGGSFFLCQIALLGVYDLVIASREEIEKKFINKVNFLFSYFIFYISGFSIFIIFFIIIYKINLNINVIIFFYLFSLNYYFSIFLKHLNQFWFSEIALKILPSLLMILIMIISDLKPIIIYNISGLIILFFQACVIKKNLTIKNLYVSGTLKYAFVNLKFFYTNILDNLNNYLPILFLGYFTPTENIAIWNIFSFFYRALSFHSDVSQNFFRFNLRNSTYKLANLKKYFLKSFSYQLFISIILSIGTIIIIKHILIIMNVDEFLNTFDFFYMMPFIAVIVILQTIILIDFYYSPTNYVTKFIVIRTVGILLCLMLGHLMQFSLPGIFLFILIFRTFLGVYSIKRFFILLKN